MRDMAICLSDDPNGHTKRKHDLLPMQNCAAVDPSSVAGVQLYRVLVATFSFHLGVVSRVRSQYTVPQIVSFHCSSHTKLCCCLECLLEALKVSTWEKLGVLLVAGWYRGYDFGGDIQAQLGLVVISVGCLGVRCLLVVVRWMTGSLSFNSTLSPHLEAQVCTGQHDTVIMLDRNIINGYLLPIHFAYKEAFSQLILNQLGEKNLDTLAISWMMILSGWSSTLLSLRSGFRSPHSVRIPWRSSSRS